MKQFSGVTLRGLKLENKTYTLKRSINFSQGMDLMKSYLRWTANFTTKPPIVTTTINLKSDLQCR